MSHTIKCQDKGTACFWHSRKYHLLKFCLQLIFWFKSYYDKRACLHLHSYTVEGIYLVVQWTMGRWYVTIYNLSLLEAQAVIDLYSFCTSKIKKLTLARKNVHSHGKQDLSDIITVFICNLYIVESVNVLFSCIYNVIVILTRKVVLYLILWLISVM